MYARDIARASQNSARSKFEVGESLAISTTSLARDKDEQFPLLTIPDFEVQATNSRELSDTDMLIYAPLVHVDQQGEWQTYATENQGWLRQSLDYVGMSNVDPGRITAEVYNTRDFTNRYHNLGLHPELENVMAPLW